MICLFHQQICSLILIRKGLSLGPRRKIVFLDCQHSLEKALQLATTITRAFDRLLLVHQPKVVTLLTSIHLT